MNVLPTMLFGSVTLSTLGMYLNSRYSIGSDIAQLRGTKKISDFQTKKNHNVDLAFGLGLAPSVWKKFRERFGVDWIIEYYSSSESTAMILNSNFNDAGVGRVSHSGPLMKLLGPDTFDIVKTDVETKEIVRHPKTGFCIRIKVGEPGESICRIRPPFQQRHNYIGKGGAEATEKMTARNVFTKGDEFFRLGDILKVDSEGYLLFADRLGDTYRVKGHNISTTEVEDCLCRHPAVASANIYAIPMGQYWYEGQLGCAAIEFTHAEATEEEKIITGLERWITASDHGLPPYAVPRFLIYTPTGSSNLHSEPLNTNQSDTERISSIMKKVKLGLRNEGLNAPTSSTDRMYWIEKEGSGPHIVQIHKYHQQTFGL